MRYLFLLLFFVGGGYLLSTRQAAPGVKLPESMVWREVTRDANGEVELVQVVAIQGDRWRCEARAGKGTNTLVLVSDGQDAVASHPQSNAAALDPRPDMEMLLRAVRGRPEATEEVDGHRLLRYPGMADGRRVQVWVDAATKFPERIQFPAEGGTGRANYYTVLASPTAEQGDRLFDVQALTPAFGDFLTVR
jgi:hypothetical protein